ncbi:MAG: aminoacyl-tRNA hydrolase [Acidimicrobiaceae bacterium]|nr:aminoacyl-tRNA hydrolase [Acidimicrobiaceae bacterium]
MADGPGVNRDGSLHINARVDIPVEQVVLRVTTSGGPGGQHANRSLTRVIASVRVDNLTSLTPHEAAMLTDSIGPVVRSSAGRFRSQGQNREAALEQLAAKIALAIERPTPRRATRPTKGSKVRRVDEKKARGRVKQQRRRPLED